MKFIKHPTTVFVAALALSGLAACSTPAVQPAASSAAVSQAVRITPFNQAEVDEAASAYVAAYANSVNSSLSAGQYIESLAFLHVNAESCLSSRASRLLGKELTPEEKGALVSQVVAPEQVKAYQRLSNGYLIRANGLEMFSCEHAGLKVATSAKY